VEGSINEFFAETNIVHVNIEGSEYVNRTKKEEDDNSSSSSDDSDEFIPTGTQYDFVKIV
jgi:hypothetical protein